MDTVVQPVVFRDLLELARAEMLIAGLGGVLAAGDAVLGAASAGEDTVEREEVYITLAMAIAVCRGRTEGGAGGRWRGGEVEAERKTEEGEVG